MSKCKLLFCLGLAAAMSTLSLRSFALPGGNLLQAGVLTGSGQITINGKPVQSGATVLSGNTVATGSNGNATIDLGDIGKVRLGSNTRVTISFGPEGALVRIECDGAETLVSQGSAQVRKPTQQDITTGQSVTLKAQSEVVFKGSDITITCTGPTVRGLAYSTPGLIGVIVFAGVATGVVLGVTLGGREEASPVTP